MENFTPWSSAAGGVLIGLSAAALLVFKGRVAGISGIAGGLLDGDRRDMSWRLAFVAGLAVAGATVAAFIPEAFANTVSRTPATLIVAGVLVGFGTRLGNGCTSGHGVCGVSRGATRSLAATTTFMLTGVAAALAGHLLQGRL